MYATPHELLGMAESERDRLFKQALDHVRDTGHLQPSDLQLHIFASPQTVVHPLNGYEGGSFDPLQLGVACIVLPPPEGRAPKTKGSTWGHNPVSAPPLA